MPNINRYNSPMQPMAENLASRGRYGDSMLVHMNPIEVQGLASLSPTGSLTRNPDTGQPEAFLPLALGLLGSGLGGAGMLGGLGSLAAGAIGSGLGSFIETGDLKEGIKSGLMSALMGKVSGELLKGLGGGAKDVAASGSKAAADAATVAADAASKGVPYSYTSIPSNVGGNMPAVQQGIDKLMLERGLAAAQPGTLASAGSNIFGLDPAGKTSQFLGGLDKSLASPFDPTTGIVPTGLVPGMTAAGMSWQPDPMGAMLEDDEDDWGEGILKDRGFQAAPQGYRPGVDPEWDYYRNPFDIDVRPRQFKRGGLIG